MLGFFWVLSSVRPIGIFWPDNDSRYQKGCNHRQPICKLLITWEILAGDTFDRGNEMWPIIVVPLCFHVYSYLFHELTYRGLWKRGKSPLVDRLTGQVVGRFRGVEWGRDFTEM